MFAWLKNFLGPKVKARAGEYAAGTLLHFDHVMYRHDQQPISYASVDRIWVAFIRAIEKEGISAGGGISPTREQQPGEKECPTCEGSRDCPRCEGQGFIPGQEEVSGEEEIRSSDCGC